MNNGYVIHYLYIYSEFSFAWNTQFVMLIEMHCFSASLERDCYAFKTEDFIFSKKGLSISNWKVIFKGFCLTSEDSGIDKGKFFSELTSVTFLIEKQYLPLSHDYTHSSLSLLSGSVCALIPCMYNRAKIILFQSSSVCG